ncbi:MAG: N-acetylneuraminate synthase [Thaumarchaeota archaeon]|nr:MAG: N-acetylneuraminate synthase [Nitrososphaerota archaeon]
MIKILKSITLSNDKKIGDECLPFIIAEIGNNHNGSVKKAKELIKKAKEINVDAVKFQIKDIEKSFSKELLDSPYEGQNSFGKTYREHKEFLEFNFDELKEIYDYANEIGIICFSTPFDITSVEILEKLKNPIYKISSFHVTDIPLIEAICKTKKPIILSTGMSSLQEVENAVKIIKDKGNELILLQCTSCYPTDDKDVNLRVINSYKKKFEVLVGYSGHERGTSITSAAIVLGACVLERHFTLDRTMKGPDHASSVETEGMKLIVEKAQRIFNSLGENEKKVLGKKFRGY